MKGMVAGAWRSLRWITAVLPLLAVMTVGCGRSAPLGSIAACRTYKACLATGAEVLKTHHLLTVMDPSLEFTEGFTRQAGSEGDAVVGMTFVETRVEGGASVTVTARSSPVPPCHGTVVGQRPGECAVAAQCLPVVSFLDGGLLYIVGAFPSGACVPGFGRSQLPTLERLVAGMA